MNDRHQLFIGLFILAFALGLGVWQWSELQGLKGQIIALQTEATNLTSISSALASDYKEINVDVASAREQTKQAFAQVLPQNEDLTALTRMFDNYEAANNFASNPFFISAIQYSSASTDEEFTAYRSISFNLSVNASKKNLSKFLEMIETSGSLEAETRLMSIGDLNISYPAQYGGTYDVRADVQAYYAPVL